MLKPHEKTELVESVRRSLILKYGPLPLAETRERHAQRFFPFVRPVPRLKLRESVRKRIEEVLRQ